MNEGAHLSARRDVLVDISAAIGSRRPDHLKRALLRAVGQVDPAAVDEVILQSHLFVGYPVALEAMLRWRSTLHRQPDSGEMEGQEWRARGSENCRIVYGDNYSKLRQNVSALHPDLDRWMVEIGYGRVLSRAGLSLADRELCIVALLAVWDSPRQLHSHIRGALNAGSRRSDVSAAMDAAGRLLVPDRIRELEALWKVAAPPAESIVTGETG